MKNALQVAISVPGEPPISYAWFTSWDDAMDYANPYLKDQSWVVSFSWSRLEVHTLE